MSKKKKDQLPAEHVASPVVPRMKALYADAVRPKLAEQFGVSNVMAQPKLEKIVVSVGLGKQLSGTKVDPVAKEQTLADLALITGQKPVMVKARKSVSNFKVREGYETGAMVTVRGYRMWELLDRVITLAIPRIKDFRGLSDKAFDGRGNYSFGVSEQGIFPEIDMANARFTHGMHITMVWKNSSDEMTRFALAEMGFPFVKPEPKNN